MLQGPTAFDAILFKYASRQLKIVLKHDHFTHLDVTNEREVGRFLKHLGVRAGGRKSPGYFTGGTVLVTRSPAPKAEEDTEAST